MNHEEMLVILVVMEEHYWIPLCAFVGNCSPKSHEVRRKGKNIAEAFVRAFTLFLSDIPE